MSASESVCPGCGLKMPRRDNALYDGGYGARVGILCVGEMVGTPPANQALRR
jgi:hypothetical protein